MWQYVDECTYPVLLFLVCYLLALLFAFLAWQTGSVKSGSTLLISHNFHSTEFFSAELLIIHHNRPMIPPNEGLCITSNLGVPSFVSCVPADYIITIHETTLRRKSTRLNSSNITI